MWRQRTVPSIALGLALACAWSSAPAQSMATGWLGAPPVVAPDGLAAARISAEPATLATALPDVDNANRYRVGAMFQRAWRAQAAVPMGWNGHVASCNAGSNSPAYRQAVIDRVNLYRVLAGLPGTVTLRGAGVAAETQAAALLFSANQNLSHQPPANWICWTQAGYDGAGKSNIALGYGSNAAAGLQAVDLYMDDAGSSNTFVGHRRWILYPPQRAMDSGSIPWAAGTGRWAANALYVLGSMGARPPTPQGVAWPARGYMPRSLLPAASHRWSLSIANADFDAASVRMWIDGVAMLDPLIEPMNNGQPSGPAYGDNSLVWRVDDADYAASAPRDVVYHVEVTGIEGAGVPAAVAYEVIVFDAFDPIFAAGFQ